MHEGGCGPACIRCMAGIALRIGCHVRGRFDLRIDRNVSTAMTSRTGTRTNRCRGIGSAGVVHPGRRERGEVGVAYIACNRGRQVFCRFAERIGPVVTGSTATGHRTGMGIARRLPSRCVVTGIAGLRTGRNMRYGLRSRVGSCKSAVMAGETVPCSDWPSSRCMIHRSRRKNREPCMTGTALRRRRNMRRRFGFCINVFITTAMTGRTVSQTGMIHGCRAERDEILVAIRTLRSCRNMRRRHANGRAIVMASRTIGIPRIMSPGSSRPSNRRRMARIALTSITNVGRRLFLRIAGYIGTAMTS